MPRPDERVADVDGSPLPALTGTVLRSIHAALRAHHGEHHWWPAETPFEVAVGAVLTQNAAWTNVERAIANLRGANALEPRAIVDLDHPQLAALLRPSGYFNLKAGRLKSLCRWWIDAGGYETLSARPTAELRSALLAVHGVGPETADDILLYAFHRPVFVIDAYTRRILSRIGLIGGREGYESLRRAFEHALGPDTVLFNEYHALIVMHAKELCRPKPRCGACPLRGACAAA